MNNLLEDKLKTISWREFEIENVFEEVKSSEYSLDYISLQEKHRQNKKIAYITRTAQNNGISNFIADMSDENNKPIDGNCITIGLDTATINYQCCPFYTGQNIHIIRDKKLNRYIALFVIPLIQQSLDKFSWGGYSATLGRFRKTRISLPVTQQGNPDWNFMEQFMKDIEKEVEPEILFINHEITDKRTLNEVEWKEFKLEEVFNIKSGKRLTRSNMRQGSIPFIGAVDKNNGITEYVSNVNESLDFNILGVNYNGSVVENFYHPYKCVFSDDVKRLSLKNKVGNKYIYLFLKTAILQQKDKYRYAYKFNANRMKKQKILLPVKQEGGPDWNFMEQYMKRIEQSIYEYHQELVKEMM